MIAGRYNKFGNFFANALSLSERLGCTKSCIVDECLPEPIIT